MNKILQPTLPKICAKITFSCINLLGLVGFFILSNNFSLLAQQNLLKTERNKIIIAQVGRQKIDTLTVLPQSVVVQDSATAAVLDSSFFSISDNFLIWKKQSPYSKIRIKYRTLPFLLGRNWTHLDTARISPTANGEAFFEYNPYENSPQRGMPDFKGLDYNGSFSRGISFGNNQNLSLNSNFNLQLAGNITDDIELLAALSDNNIPLQPEGNTQRLQDFGRIFIQLKRKQSTLIVGDYDLLRPSSSYFMNYNKKLQGASFSSQIKLTKNSYLLTKNSAAISRGKSSRNIIAAQEGNQGPYRLRGRDGEQFFIILSGTERVWIDGVLMRRGLDEDYVIDYNRADVTFSNRRLITKDSRIIVEFEYNDLNYLRTLYTSGLEYKNKKLALNFELYSEQDSKNSSGTGVTNPRFDSLSKAVLRSAGNQSTNLLVSSIDTASFSPDRVLYELRDTTVATRSGDSTYNVLIYSINPQNAKYRASFLEVGAGNGNYVQISSSANGRVYAWVAPNPVTNQPKGNFEPVSKVTPPIVQQLYTLGGKYQFSERSALKVETAMSNFSNNRYAQNAKLPLGGAIFSQYNGIFDLQPKIWQLSLGANYEFAQAKFKPLNVYRAAEFLRDWNVENNLLKADEHLAKGGFSLQKIGWGSISYELATFQREQFYRGIKQTATLNAARNGLEIKAQFNILEAKTPSESIEFLRPKVDVSYIFQKINNLKLGFYGEQERNRRTAQDTLQRNSFYYNLAKIYLISAPSQKIEYGISYSQRYDYKPIEKKFLQNTRADELNVNGHWQQNKSSQITWNLTYRNLRTDSTQQSNYLGRIDYNLNLWRGSVRWFNSYELGSGQEQKIDYQYIPVADGQLGVYQGIDRNGDGVLQQDEYEIAPTPATARYIRVTVLTNRFVKTHNVQYNQTFSLEPRAAWSQSKNRFLLALNHWSFNSNFRINRRIAAAGAGDAAWNPFATQVSDTNLVVANTAIRNTLFFNKNHEIYELQVGNSSTLARQILSAGLESRQNMEQFFRSRWNISQSLSNNFYAALGDRLNNSQSFVSRNYRLKYLSLEPQLSYLWKKNMRILLSYKYLRSKNIESDGGEQLRSNDFNVETTYNTATATSLRTKFSYVQVAYEGRRNTPAEFALLDGLQSGKNYILNISLDRRMANNIQLGVSYEGRKTGTTAILHTGRAQVRATF